VASNHPIRTLSFVLATCAAIVTQSARADTLQDVSRLVSQGRPLPALKLLDKYLVSRPNDVPGRFLKGVILAETNSLPEAVSIFTKLAEEHPELPEPYNNLAVIYARQQQYDKAKQALEAAIQTHPAYATAHKNLEDVYARLASQAYDKALQTDSLKGSAPVKLATIREITSTPLLTLPALAAAKPPVDIVLAERKAEASELLAANIAAIKPDEPALPAETAKPGEVGPAESRFPAAIPASVAAVSAGEPAKPANAALAATTATAPNTASVETTAKPVQSAAATGDITKELTGWLAAWSDKNVEIYLAHYATDFQTPGGESRAAWESERTTRIKKPGAIRVTYENLQIAVDGDVATAKFRQHYQSAKLKTATSKVLNLVYRAGRWLIQQERIGK
jgi:hypothetical protein